MIRFTLKCTSNKKFYVVSDGIMFFLNDVDVANIFEYCNIVDVNEDSYHLEFNGHINIIYEYSRFYMENKQRKEETVILTKQEAQKVLLPHRLATYLTFSVEKYD